MKIGVVGASGFVGNRAVEMLHGGDTEVRPIGRTVASLDRFVAEGLDCRVAGAFDQSALETAFEGCDVVIHSILGSPGLIRGSIAPTYKAAQKAGVRRIIYLSSMIVHRPAPAPGTTEATPLVANQPYAAHPAKIDAERKLMRLRKKGAVEVVIFRPGIVFGPRSRWVTDLATQLSQGTAYFINEGQGICNSVYVDNLIHAMRLSLTAPNADGEAFFVGDRELVTWFDFYRPFAEAFGVDPKQIPQLTAPEFTQSWKQRVIDPIRNSELVQRTLSTIPHELKQTAKAFIPKRGTSSPEQQPTAIAKPEPVITQMMAELQQSQYKLPFSKAEKFLGYEPIVSFDEGCNRSIQWLAKESPFNRLVATYAIKQQSNW
ncbi:MAG: NAD(P)-dependent oxidoreductase [Oscillatoriales cyanobacterium C42_A2020_001]|nr:NAD(P)-dependent oxidoreductase [Leptolyngbyaceae cyanobacterium C42_A2020_001]